MVNSMKKVLVLPGDNIGPEIIAEAVKVLEMVNNQFALGIELDYAHLGGAALDAVGEPCPKETLDKARAADAILLGAVGGPQWDDVERHLRPEKGLLTIRSLSWSCLVIYVRRLCIRSWRMRLHLSLSLSRVWIF